MSRPHVRFVHFGDVHLGFRQYGLPERAADFARAFRSAVAYCVEVNPDFVVMAGDLFDSKSIDPQTYADADVGLSKLADAGIPVVAVEGNHERWFRRGERSWLWQLSRGRRLRLLQQADPGYEGQTWRPWTAERGYGAYTDIGPVRIFGVEYLGARLGAQIPEVIKAAQQLPAHGVQFRIGVLHTGVNEESPVGQGGIDAVQVLALREVADYLALGHIHYRYELPSEEPFIFNPGALESHNIVEGIMDQRAADDGGRERGLYDVAAWVGPRPTIRAQFRDDVVVRRPFVRLAVDVSRSRSFDDICVELTRALHPSPVPTEFQPMVNVVLRGALGFDRAMLDQPALIDLVRKHYDPLHVRVTLNLERPISGGLTARTGSRSQIERDVVHGLIAQHSTCVAESDALAEKTLELKRMVLEGQTEEALAPIVEATVP